jgi:hypothetical protein
VVLVEQRVEQVVSVVLAGHQVLFLVAQLFLLTAEVEVQPTPVVLVELAQRQMVVLAEVAIQTMLLQVHPHRGLVVLSNVAVVVVHQILAQATLVLLAVVVLVETSTQAQVLLVQTA